MRRFTLFLVGLIVMPGCGGSDAQPATSPQKKNTPMFVERAAESGLVFHHHSGAGGQYSLPSLHAPQFVPNLFDPGYDHRTG